MHTAKPNSVYASDTLSFSRMLSKYMLEEQIDTMNEDKLSLVITCLWHKKQRLSSIMQKQF